MRAYPLLIGLLVALLLIGCEGSKSVSSDELAESLKELILTDEVTDLEALNDGGALPSIYDYGTLAKTTGDTLPIDWRLVRYGRKITGRPTREVEITLAETTAVALVTTTITGQFKVVLIDTTTHTVIDSVLKDFTEMARQKLQLKRVRYTERPKKDWRVTAASPIIGRSLGNTIEIKQIRLQPRNASDNLILSNDSNDSLLDCFLDRERLVALHANGSYLVQVAIENSQPFYQEPAELVTLDFGIKPGWLKFRRPLQDVDNDNIFTGVIDWHGKQAPMCRLVINVIDYASIFVKSAPLNSTFWAVPYRVH